MLQLLTHVPLVRLFQHGPRQKQTLTSAKGRQKDGIRILVFDVAGDTKS